MPDGFPPLPNLDITKLHDDLEALYQRARAMAELHHIRTREAGVPYHWVYSNFIFKTTDSPSIGTEERDKLYWHDYDRAGDYVQMSVPIDVILGERTIADWVQQTVLEHLERVEEEEKRKAEHKAKTRDVRLKLYEELKQEFEAEHPHDQGDYSDVQ